MKVQAASSKYNFLSLFFIVMGFLLSLVVMYILLQPMLKDHFRLSAESYKAKQSEIFSSKIDKMIELRGAFKNSYQNSRQTVVIEKILADSAPSVGLIEVDKNGAVALGNRSIKFSYDYLSTKRSNAKWTFENIENDYFIVNTEEVNGKYFIVYENLKNLINQQANDRYFSVDSLVFLNSEGNYLVYSNDKITRIKYASVNKDGIKSSLLYYKMYGVTQILKREILISYSLKYEIFTLKYVAVVAVFIILFIVALIIYSYGLSKSVGQVLRSLIIKMNDFTLGRNSNIVLPLHRKDVVGDVIREFEKLVRNISAQNKEIESTNSELEKKSSYLSKKMDEIKKLKDMIIKSFNTQDVDSMVKELTQVLQNVFNAYGVVLVRKTEDAVKMYNTFTSTDVAIESVKSFVATEIRGIEATKVQMSESKYKNGNKIYFTITLPVRVQNKVLGYLVIFSDESFEERELDVITTFNSQVSVVLENLRLYGEERTKNKLQNEFMDAQEIQDILINKGEEKRREIGVETYYLPAINIGGDWFDAVKISETKYLYMIADITGHGAASALITTMFSTYFKVFQEIFGADIFQKNDVATLISGLNDVFVNLTGGVKNATFAIAFYDKEEMSIDYLSAGHNASYLYDSRKGKVKSLQVKNVRLGDEKKVRYISKKIYVNSGDTLFMYTDGLIENLMYDGNEYSKKRLMNLLKKYLVANDSKNLKQVLRKDINENVDLKKLDDDVTFLVAKL